MFSVNDYVVYKKDVCRILKIKDTKDGNYYSMSPVNDDSLIINIPVKGSDKVLRDVMSASDAKSLINSIPSIKIIDSNDKMIENEYKTLMNTGIKEDLIKVIKTAYIRNLSRLSSGKKVGEKDSNYLEKAENLLYTEIAISLDKSYDDTKKYIINKVKELMGE